jgi:hypothetical protein
MARISLTMKTAPLLHRNLSEFTSQCEDSNITVMVGVIWISLYNEDRGFLEGKQSKDQALQAGRPCIRFHLGSLIQCTVKKSIGASYVDCKHETFKT